LCIGVTHYKESLKAIQETDGEYEWLDTIPTPRHLSSKTIVIDFLPEDGGKRDALLTVALCSEWHGTVASMIEKNSAAHWALETGLGDRFVGFSMPPGAGKIPAVELYKGELTSPEAIDSAASTFKNMGWHVAICRDQAGGILSRVLAGMINEAAFMAQSNIASVDQIDRMMKLAANFPLGPFEWADRIGLDRLLSLLEMLAKEFGPIYQPCPMIRRKVDAGKLGRKTGEGFHVYSAREA
jgi:3-hydroxybutyryl-CoA dehydrogenase